jgi:phosphoribosylcarboxyaminoimidazole (NCAIR) mutase
MSVNTTGVSGSYYIKENLTGGIVDGVLRKTPLLNTFRAFGKFEPVQGSSTVSWSWIYGDQEAASAWTEQESITTFGGTLSVRGSKAPSYGKVAFGVTDFQLMNAENAGLIVSDIVQHEQDKATESLFKYFEDLFCGSSAGVGISSILDATGNVLGINQATYSTWAAVETSVSASSFLGGVNSTYASLASRNTNFADTVIFCSPAVVNIYQSATSGSNQGQWGAQVRDNGLGAAAAYNGMPIVACPGMSDDEMYFVDMSDAVVSVAQLPRVDPVPTANLGANLCVHGAMAFYVKDRRRHAKITNISLRSQ